MDRAGAKPRPRGAASDDGSPCTEWSETLIGDDARPPCYRRRADDHHGSRRLRRLADLRALRRLGLQPGDSQAGDRGRRADRPDGVRAAVGVVCVIAYASPPKGDFVIDGTLAAGAAGGPPVRRGVRRPLQIAALDDGVAGDRVHYAAPFFVAFGAGFC